MLLILIIIANAVFFLGWMDMHPPKPKRNLFKELEQGIIEINKEKQKNLKRNCS